MARSRLQLALGPGSRLNWAMRFEGGKHGVPAFNLPERWVQVWAENGQEQAARWAGSPLLWLTRPHTATRGSC